MSDQLAELQRTFDSVNSGGTRGKQQHRRTAKRMVRNKSAIQDLQKSLNDNPRFGKMVEYSVTCLKSMAVDAVCAEELIEEGVLDTLVKILKVNPYQEGIHTAINDCIAARMFVILRFFEVLGENDELAALVAEKLGPDQLLFSCLKHTTPESVASSCNTMASIMRQVPENINMFVEGGAIEALDHVSATMQNQPEVMANVAKCLSSISTVPTHIPALLKTDILHNLMKTLQENPENTNLVKSSLGFLAAISAVDGPHIQQLRDMGVVDLIAATLEANADDKETLQLGAKALRHLAQASDIHAALKSEATVTNETANALAKLSSLMLVDENIDKMIDAQGIPWLMATLKNACEAPPSETSYRIMVSGARAVERICADEKKIYAVMQAQGVPTLLQMVSKHGGDEAVLAASMGAIAHMITRKENAEMFQKCKIMNAVDSALKAHPNSERVAKQALEIIGRMARHSSVHQDLNEHDAVKQIYDILKKFKDDPEMCKLAMQALQRLSNNPQAVERMMELGIADLIDEVLKKHKDDPAIVGHSIDLLSAIAQGHPQGADYVKKSKVMKSLLNALDAQKDNVALQEHGSEFMKVLAGENELQDAVNNVNNTAQKMIKDPKNAEQEAQKLKDATEHLKNLAQIESNYKALEQMNAQAAMMAAMQAALLLPVDSPLRNEILHNATQGLNALAQSARADAAARASAEGKGGKEGGKSGTMADEATAAFAKQVLADGTLFKLLNSVLKETQDEATAEAAMAILAELAQHPELHDELIKSGAIDYAIQIAKLFPYNEAIQAAAASTLATLAQNNSKAIAEIVKAGGAQTIVDSIRTNMDSKEELLNSLEVLKTIAEDPEITTALLGAGVIDSVLDVWRKFEKEPDVVDSCLQALIVMLNSEEVAVEMGEKGVFDLAIPAIRTHYRQPVLIESNVVLLDSLASAKANTALLADPEYATVELMEWVARKFASRPLAVEAANRVRETIKQHQEDEEKARLALEVERYKLEDGSVQELFNNMVNAEKKDELTTMFTQLDHLMANEEVVKMLAANGGLDSMTKLMLANTENEDIFKKASTVFLRMCCDYNDEEINTILCKPLPIRAHSEIVKPHPQFATKVPEEQVVQATIGLGKVTLDEEGLTALYQSGGLAALSQMLTTSKDPDALREGARVLGKATANETINANIVPNMQKGLNGFATIRELIDAMRANITNLEFVRFGIYILGNLAINDQIKQEIGVQSGVVLILEAIDVHRGELSLVKNAYYALATLTFNNPVNCCFVMAASGIPKTLEIMKANQGAPDLLDSCLCVLCNMCNGNDGNKLLIVNADGSKTIVDTVLNNFDQVDVLLSAFRMLGILAFNAQSVDAIIKAGGVQGIVAGMTVLADKVDVIDVAIRVLTNLASNCTEDHMKIMAEEGAVQAIVGVMSSHTSNVDIALSSCTALVNLSVMHYNADQIIKQGGVEIIIKALATLGYDPEFVDMAIRVLFNLTYSVNNLNRIINAGIAAAILTVLKSMMSNSGVITIGLRCISNLCYSDEVALRIAQDGPIEFILALIRQHLSSPEKQSDVIIAECLTCLSALSRNENNALAMTANAINACIKIIQTMQDSQLLIATVRFLANLFVYSAAAISATETEFTPELTKLWAREINNVELLLIGIKPVENMAFASQTVRDYLKAKNCIEGLDAIKQANQDRQDLIECANAAIFAINRSEVQHDTLEFVEITRSRRTLKDVYDAIGEKREEKIEDVVELPPRIKNFLTGGALLMKHSKKAQPRPRHFFLTDDIKWLVWKDPKLPGGAIDESYSMKVFQIRSVERGRCTPQLQRQRFGKYLAEEKHCFSIQGRQRTIDLECSSERDRERWVHAIEVLIAYKKTLQSNNQAGTSFY